MTPGEGTRFVCACLVAFQVSCDVEGDLSPGPEILPDAYCCPSWLGSDSLLIYRDGGLADAGDEGLWVSFSDGSDAWMVLAGGIYTPAFAPGSAVLAFESGTQIFAVDVVDGAIDTLTMRQLTSSGSSFLPGWSPDGQWLAYDRRVCDFGGGSIDTTCGVFVVRPDGSDRRFIAQGVYPIWSPDGTALVFSLHGEVYSVGFPLVGDVRQLSSFHVLFASPPAVGSMSFSPDGSIILVELRTRPDITLWTMPSEGGPPTQLRKGKWPSWSPSGRFVAFIKEGDVDPEKNGTVWLFDVDSGEARQLTRR